MKALLLVVLILVLIPAVALAQKPPAGCPLLTNAEIAAATGMKVGEAHEADMQLAKGQGTMNGCMWKVGDRGMANVSVMAAIGTKEDREKGLARLRQVYAGLKAKGWTVSETKLGDVLCNTAIPPQAESDQAPAMVGCFGVAKGFVYSAGILGPHFKVAPEKVKALADDLVKRLP